MKSSKVWILSILLLAWAILGTVGSAYYYSTLSELEKEHLEIGERLEVVQRELQEAVSGKGELGERYSRLLAEHQALLDRVVIVSIYIDYGNGSVKGYEDIPLSKDHPTVLAALSSVADIEVQQFPEMGIFITSINGVRGSQEKSLFWLYYVVSIGQLIEPTVAADKFILHNGDRVLWNYTKFG
jgi:hypothetical protein